jgi:hypothetical protein
MSHSALKIKDALDAWVTLTGVDPEGQVFTIGHNGSWDIQRINKELNQALELDETGIICLILLDYFANKHLRSQKFQDVTQMQKYAKDFEHLHSILHSDALKQQQKIFRQTTLAVLDHYGLKNNEIQKIVLDDYRIAFLYRDALKSMNSLETHQFLHGEPETTSPKFNKKVYGFWNINSMLDAVCSHMESGISVCLIQEPEMDYSYFVFAVRNGGTLTVLTDRGNYAHPMQKNMMAQRARGMARNWDYRTSQHWFPYELIDVEMDHDKGILTKEEATGLVQYQKEVYPIKDLMDLKPETVIWILMMFEQIKQKYFIENHKVPELSYTGEMVQVSHALIERPAVKALAVSGYKKLLVKPLTRQDLTQDLNSYWSRDSAGANNWAVERYGDQVSEEIFNQVDTGPGHQKRLSKTNPRKVLTVASSGDDAVPWPLAGIDPTDFGSKKKLLKDRMYIARHNQAIQIQALAQKEYDETLEKIQEWFRKAISKNMPCLLIAAAHNLFLTHNDGWVGCQYGKCRLNDEQAKTNACSLYLPGQNGFYGPIGSYVFNSGYKGQSYDHCYLTETRTALRISFYVATAQAMADLCGIPVEKLPPVLRGWKKETGYRGNSILDAIDPMDHVFKNPWQRENFDVIISLSKSGYNTIRKEAGLPPHKPWNIQKGECLMDHATLLEYGQDYCPRCGNFKKRMQEA